MKYGLVLEQKTTWGYIPAHSIALEIGTNESVALPMFQAITGCYTDSLFNNKRKKPGKPRRNTVNETALCLIS